jgi:hypothetical protein
MGIASMIEKSSSEVTGIDQLAAVCPSLPINETWNVWFGTPYF